MITYNHSFPHFIVSRLMRGGRIHTIDADEDGEGEPQEESWFKKKEKRVGKLTKGKGVNKATASSRAIEYEDMMPAAYPGDPTDQEVIDHVRSLPDILRPWGKVIVLYKFNHITRKFNMLKIVAK